MHVTMSCAVFNCKFKFMISITANHEVHEILHTSTAVMNWLWSWLAISIRRKPVNFCDLQWSQVDVDNTGIITVSVDIKQLQLFTCCTTYRTGFTFNKFCCIILQRKQYHHLDIVSCKLLYFTQQIQQTTVPIIWHQANIIKTPQKQTFL